VSSSERRGLRATRRRRSTKHLEFAGTVFCADTRPFWRDHSASPTNDGSHWNAKGESYFLSGDAMGKGLVDMLKGSQP
jgi:hypothetical protein